MAEYGNNDFLECEYGSKDELKAVLGDGDVAEVFSLGQDKAENTAVGFFDFEKRNMMMNHP